jgi:hypothetical protein
MSQVSTLPNRNRMSPHIFASAGCMLWPLEPRYAWIHRRVEFTDFRDDDLS